MSVTLHGARLVDANGDVPAGDISFEGRSVTAVGPRLDSSGGESASSASAMSDAAPDAAPDAALDARVIDASGLIVMPGFIDTHTHGGGGASLQTTDPDEIRAFARWAPSTGVTGFLVAVVGAPNALPAAQIAAAVAACDDPHGGQEGQAGQDGAEPLGIHLEGPYISERRRGAHLASWLRTPDPAETERLLALAQGWLRIVTLAPELPGGAALIRRLVEAGVTVSLGHSDATYEQALEAVRLGVTQITHCCNAMRPLLHRDPGPLSALSESPTVYGEVIADGVHVHPAMVRALLKLMGPERAILITDAQAGAGAEDATFEFGGQPAHVANGAARLADGTLTGSVLTMDQALRNVMSMTPVTLSAASAMLARNPARAAHVAETKGLLRPGYDADLVVLDDRFTLQATYCGGALAYASEGWLARLSGRGRPHPQPLPRRGGRGEPKP